MDLQEQLAAIEQAYEQAEEENKESVLEAIQGIHLQLMQDPQADLNAFYEALLTLCGGVYIPYIFWVELTHFMQRRDNSPKLYRLIEGFAASNFEDEEQHKMKPLLAVYFAKESEFALDKVKAYIIDKAHPQVQTYFRNIIRFAESQANTIDAYVEKLNLLKDFYPDFNLFDLPVMHLKEQLGVA